MLRQFHKIPGLIAGLLIVVLATSGAVLSVLPAVERAGVPTSASAEINVAELAGAVVDRYPGVEQIVRKPSGKIVVYYFRDDLPGADVIDPVTIDKVAEYSKSGFQRWMTNLHRSLFLDETGRALAGLGALAMLILSYSGLSLTAKRLGGWRKLTGRVRGNGTQRLHVETGRIAVAAFVLSAATAIYMSLANFGFIPDGLSAEPVFPRNVNGGVTMSVADIADLQAIPVADLRELTFPYADDPSDVFAITSATGSGYIDQSTGQMLSYLPNDTTRNVYEFIFMLHTGQGLWWLGLVLGLAAAIVPVMSITGTVIWWRARRAAPKIAHNALAKSADTIILVGSEGNSTWGFAKTLHDALNAQGFAVHTAPMNRLKPGYAKAERMFILAATYGDGAAPATANAFLKRLAESPSAPDYPVAVLGFGDRQFPKFCQFADDVNEALAQDGWETLLPMDRIDRQSAQEFARWGDDVGAAMGINLDLVHSPERAKTNTLELLDRQDFGAEVQAPTTIFSFAVPQARQSSLWTRLFARRLPKFKAGDLVGILPPGSDMPRFYSLASASSEGVLEICVRKHPGGLCSEFLHGLRTGDRIDAFIKPNPDFRPAKGRAPVILVGAGTGIGPLAGFIRANRKARPMHLYFGGRDPKSDYLYEGEIKSWLQDKRLHTANLAFSRITDAAYVQNRITADAVALRALLADGAQIMVCGGRDMARGVMEAIDAALAPTGLNAAVLKAEGRYLEDVY